MRVNDIKISLKIENKNQLSIERILLNLGKKMTPRKSWTDAV